MKCEPLQQEAMTAQMRAFLDGAVEDGTLTREQADLMLEYHEQYSGLCHSGGVGGYYGMGQMMWSPSSAY